MKGETPLVLARAEQNVEEVQGRCLDLDYYLTQARLRFFHLLQLQGLLGVSKLVHLPSVHRGLLPLSI